MEFVILSFATFLVWITFASILPVRITPRLQPFVVTSLALGLYYVPEPWLIIIAAAGGVALLRSLIGEALDPIDFTRLKNLIPHNADGKKERKPAAGVGIRIPTL